MKNTLEKRLFTNLLITENGIIKKENREWVKLATNFKDERMRSSAKKRGELDLIGKATLIMWR